MSEPPTKGFFAQNAGTIIVLATLIFGFGKSYSDINSANEENRKAIATAVATAHAETEAVRTDLANYVAAHEERGRERLEANTAAQSRLDTEIDGVRKEVTDQGRKLDQHEFRLTSTESTLSRFNVSIDKMTDKIEALDRNVLLLVNRFGLDPKLQESPEGGKP